MISREHYISENILNEIEDMSVSGLPWLKPGELKRMMPNDLVAKVLCERHNNCLSELDSRIGNLFRLVRQLDRITRAKDVNAFREIAIHMAFWGHDFEKWILKAILGFVSSGNAVYAGERIGRNHPIPDAHVRALFTSDDWPPYAGLYMQATVGTRFRRFDGFSMKMDWDAAEKRVKGVRVEFMGVPFVLALDPPTVDPSSIMQRPKSLAFQVGTVVKDIRFKWEK